ncbi:hypothetical protein GE21DRAFT_1292469 [Neurospora crassa]|nr:hypothetical protein GE21DRAFT_1292469 [Neurospora crassa]
MNSLWISLSSGLGITAGDIQGMCLVLGGCGRRWSLRFGVGAALAVRKIYTGNVFSRNVFGIGDSLGVQQDIR